MTEHHEQLALSARCISKTYDHNRVLHDVTVDIRRGHIHALVGGNGCGKSTFIKILAGAVTADPGGEVIIGGDTLPTEKLTPQLARELGLRFVHQDLGLFESLTVAENLVLGGDFPRNRVGGVDWRATRLRAAAVLKRFTINVDPDTRVASLRPAERAMVAIARALQDQDDADDGILILDEPTASLSITEVDALLSALRTYAARGQTIVMVSHRLTEVLSVADDITVLRDGRHIVTTPNEGLSTTDLAELIMGRRAGDGPTLRGAAGEPVLTVRGLSGGPIQDVDLTLREGEVVGIAGLVGSGRTTLLRMLSGSGLVASGTVELRGRAALFRSPHASIKAGVVYLPEDRASDASFPEMSVRENLSVIDIAKYWRGGKLSTKREEADGREAVARFGIVTQSLQQAISTLSGGNQQKVIVSRVMRTQPDVLLLDEPSQGVDVGARADINAHIRSYVEGGATALVASSDLEELAQWCDRVVVLCQGRIVAERHTPDIDPAELASLTEGVQEVSRARP